VPYWFLKLQLFLVQPVTYVVLLFGAMIGSFLNVCIIRLPQGTFLKHARSMCPQCEKPIPFYDNIPIFSWLILRGKARCCGKKISIQYVLIETVTALLFVVAYWQNPFWNSDQLAIDPGDFIRFAHIALFLSAMLVCGTIDYHHKIIPDVITLPMIALTPVVAYFHPELTGWSALLGALIGGGSLFAVAWLYYLVRKRPGLGLGDVKLLAVIGGWLGIEAILPTILVASMTGALFGTLLLVIKKDASLKSAIPFGPFLILGAAIHILFGPSILQWLL
jgi:leader peptidase (prepilin peptidase) / N-methyltransferase